MSKAETELHRPIETDVRQGKWASIICLASKPFGFLYFGPGLNDNSKDEAPLQARETRANVQYLSKGVEGGVLLFGKAVMP